MMLRVSSRRRNYFSYVGFEPQASLVMQAGAKLCIAGGNPIIEVMQMRRAASTSRATETDRANLAILGICLIVAASLAPHFGLHPTWARAVIKCDNSHSKQACVVDDGLAWGIPSPQLVTLRPVTSVRSIRGVDEWSYSPGHNGPQLYNRPPPSVLSL